MIRVKYRPRAEVAELADALRSGRSESILMWVQVPPSACCTIQSPTVDLVRDFFWQETCRLIEEINIFYHLHQIEA